MFILSGCYNNSHIRISKLLEEGKKLVSFNGSYNIAPLSYIDYGRIEYNNEFWGFGYQPISTEVAGLRSELSFLKGYKSSEAGFYGGVGANLMRVSLVDLLGANTKNI